MNQLPHASHFRPHPINRVLAKFAALALVVSPIIATTTAHAGSPTDSIIGIWYDDTGKGAVKLSDCGDQICGHIYWLKDPLNDEGEPLHDAYNPEEAKQSRPICGLQVIGKLQKQPDGTYDNGWVYDPKVGYTFNVAVNKVNAEQLHVRGYLKVKLLGESLYWKRAPDDLPQCKNPPARRAGP